MKKKLIPREGPSFNRESFYPIANRKHVARWYEAIQLQLYELATTELLWGLCWFKRMVFWFLCFDKTKIHVYVPTTYTWQTNNRAYFSPVAGHRVPTSRSMSRRDRSFPPHFCPPTSCPSDSPLWLPLPSMLPYNLLMTNKKKKNEKKI